MPSLPSNPRNHWFASPVLVLAVVLGALLVAGAAAPVARVAAQAAEQPVPEGFVVRAGPPGPETLVTSPHTEMIREGHYVPETASFSVTFYGVFPAQARIAFNFAAAIWASQITSPVPIRLTASWEDLCVPKGRPAGCDVLSEGGPTMRRDFPGAPIAGTFYPYALVDKIVGSDYDTENYDMALSFNSAWSSWYYGTDGHPGTAVDFVTIALQALGHGLGFRGTATYVSPNGYLGTGSPTTYPDIYDRNVVVWNGASYVPITTFASPSVELGAALRGGQVYWSGAAARAANGNVRPKLHAPVVWDPLASYAHLDESMYPAGNANSLMTPRINPGEAIHDPGPIARGMLTDEGWTMTAPTVPTITSVSPTFGPTSGGTVVTIAGHGFVPGVTSVIFGDLPGSSVTIASASSLTVVAPPHWSGATTVSVVTPWGTASRAGAFYYTSWPAPAITGFSPATVRGGTGAFTLTVNGANFRAGALIGWNGLPRATTYVSSTRLTAAITAADIAGARLATVMVVNPDTQSASAQFTVTASWRIVGAGDFTADGKPDLVFESGDGYVGGWGMNGFSCYGAALLWPSPVATDGWHVRAVGDLNADGSADLIWENTTTGYVAAWIMNGVTQVSNGLLYAYPVAVDGWHIVGAGDFNADRKADVLWQSDSGYVAVWFMDGTTQLYNTLLHPLPVAAGGWRIAGTGDFDKNGQTDILWVSPTGSLALWSMTGGVISSSAVVWPNPVAVGGFSVGATGDFNADTNVEIIWQHDLGLLGGWKMNGIVPTGNQLLNPSAVTLRFDERGAFSYVDDAPPR